MFGFWVIFLWCIGILAVALLRKCDEEQQRKSLSRRSSRPVNQLNQEMSLPLHSEFYQPRTTSTHSHLRNPHHNYQRRWPMFTWRIMPLRFNSHVSSPIGNSTETILRNWRKSIAGLVMHAARNLKSARGLIAERRYCEAVNVAATSVENIARALIHCCGGKPNPRSGQEEALKMICNRFEDDEGEKLEIAIDRVALFTQVKSRLEPSTINDKKARQLVTVASNINKQFSRILFENFSEEIPELLSIISSPNAAKETTFVKLVQSGRKI